MIFTIKFINLKIQESTFELIRTKVIELNNECIIHDCNTETGFTIQLKPIDYKIPGRVQMQANYDNTNTIVIAIEKEYQTPWSLEKMEYLVKELQTLDQPTK